LGFLGPGPVDAHIAHARAFAAVFSRLATNGPMLDLGSGGGIPGLVLALEQPDWQWTLLDANERRTAFLTTAVETLGLRAQVAVTRARAEELGRLDQWRQAFAAVCARSFGPPAVTAECAAPFLYADGILIVSEPPESEAARWPEQPLAALGLRRVETVSGPPRLAVLRQQSPCPERYPRRAPAKRPLW